MKEHAVKTRLLLLLGLLVMVSCGGRETGGETNIAVPVSVEEISLRPIEEFIVTTGTVNAIKEASLSSEAAGYYRLLTNPKRGRPFVLGDFVSKGQEVIHLDNPELETSIKIESQELNLDISKREYEKQQSLYEKGGVTLRELKNAERAYVEAKYAYENALLQLAKLKVVAPFDGVIVELPYYTPGVRVGANQPMVKIMNYSQLYMEANLPGVDLGRVLVNQPVRVMNYTMPKDTLLGKVTQVAPAIDPSTRTFKAALLIDNPQWLLRPGMFVKAEIVVARNDSAIVVPKEVILAKRQGKTVYVVERGAAQERVITTGLENPNEVEVVRGLRVNERLVVKGFETLQNRSRVKIVR